MSSHECKRVQQCGREKKRTRCSYAVEQEGVSINVEKEFLKECLMAEEMSGKRGRLPMEWGGYRETPKDSGGIRGARQE